MRWRGAWLRSRLTACGVGAVIWLIVTSLAPTVMVGVLAVAVVAVAGWRSALVLRCRYGARRATSDEAAIVWRALVPVVGLRGRNQPTIYVSDHFRCEIRAVDERTIVVSRRLVGWIRDGWAADLAVCELAVRALAWAPMQRSRLVAAVELFCLPWTALATVARPVSTLARRLRPLVWVFAAMAACDLFRRSEWVAIVVLALVVVATVTTPRFDRAWAIRRQVIADAVVRRHLPQQASDPAGSVRAALSRRLRGQPGRGIRDECESRRATGLGEGNVPT